MNANVIRRMMVFDILVQNEVGSNNMGDKKYKDITLKGYLCSKSEKVINDLGEETTSTEQIYLTGADVLKVNKGKASTIHYKNREIISRHIYYKPNGVPDVGVLYLA